MMVAVAAHVEQSGIVHALRRVPGMLRAEALGAPSGPGAAAEPVMRHIVEAREEADRHDRGHQEEDNRPATEEGDREQQHRLDGEIADHAIMSSAALPLDLKGPGFAELARDRARQE